MLFPSFYILVETRDAELSLNNYPDWIGLKGSTHAGYVWQKTKLFFFCDECDLDVTYRGKGLFNC